jgi:hypothetical protein
MTPAFALEVTPRLARLEMFFRSLLGQTQRVHIHHYVHP